uniref:KRAB domain-containing protein n=1 Tax=Oryctolagus cuniculus TaxID=9986 RepID=A0A5F9DB36_RABIT
MCWGLSLPHTLLCASCVRKKEDVLPGHSTVMIAFEDLAVYFTWEEWQNMNKAQKILYRDEMLETYSSLLFLGHCITKPDLIFKLEQGAEPWMVSEFLNQNLPVAMKTSTNQHRRGTL